MRLKGLQLSILKDHLELVQLIDLFLVFKPVQ